jgi:ribose transport system permease protein
VSVPTELSEVPAGTKGRPSGNISMAAYRDYAVVAALLLLAGALGLASDAFLTKSNLVNLLDQAAVIGIVACGATFVIVGGGFDLSVGAIFATAGIVAAALAQTLGVPIALLAGVATGVFLGLVNGALVGAGHINSFMATLAMSFVILGIAAVATKGFLVSAKEPGFSTLGTGSFLSMSYLAWTFILIIVVSALLLARTTFGRCVYAVGGKSEVARLSGIRVGAVRAATFALSGFTAGLAGVISASRFDQGQVGVGSTLPLDAIAAIAVGGTSIMGGQGAMWRTVIGVLLLATMDNGFVLLHVDTTYQGIVHGLIILAAVSADAFTRVRAS